MEEQMRLMQLVAEPQTKRRKMKAAKCCPYATRSARGMPQSGCPAIRDYICAATPPAVGISARSRRTACGVQQVTRKFSRGARIYGCRSAEAAQSAERR